MWSKRNGNKIVGLAGMILLSGIFGITIKNTTDQSIIVDVKVSDSNGVSISEHRADTLFSAQISPNEDVGENKDTVTFSNTLKGQALANVQEFLYIRTEPSIGSSILGKLYRGSGGDIIERRDGWTKIHSGSVTGWVSDEFMIFEDSAIPLAEELKLNKAVVSVPTLRVRTSANTQAAILGLADQGDSFAVLNNENGWVTIQFSSDLEGFVSADYVNVDYVLGKAITLEEEAKQREVQQKNTKQSRVSSDKTDISQEELKLFAACIQMESGSYSYEAQLAVANVILNRVKKGTWGSTIESVIYAKGQFPGATNGTMDIYLSRGPKESSIKAAKAALNGENNIEDYLYFNSAKRANYDSYADYKIVGGNCFYKPK